MALAAVVHCGTAPVAAAGRPAIPVPADNETLPRSAAQMRDAILAAVQSGDLADLKIAMELNEIAPDIGSAAGIDPVAYWRGQSKDGSGRDILATLGTILAMKPAIVPLGRDIENNRIFVWPYLAEADLSTLDPAGRADLARLATPDEIAAMTAARRWTSWRLVIGADGTWHAFRRER